MTSMHMTERIAANHMENAGKAFKKPEELTLEDFIPGKDETELIFCSLTSMYSALLVERCPKLYKSLKGAIRDHQPHQFQEEMKKKTEEFTGKIYEKSENRTEDLISMLDEYQNEMVLKNSDTNGCNKVMYRRQLTGDQKTEKNMHYAILRKDIKSIQID